MTIGHTATFMRAGIYRIVNAFAGDTPEAYEVASAISGPIE